MRGGGLLWAGLQGGGGAAAEKWVLRKHGP